VRLFYFLDDVGLSGPSNVDLIIDGALKIAGTSANPLVVNLTSGAHTWQVRGRDNAGNSALSEIRALNVVNGAAPPATLKNEAFVPPNLFRFEFDSVAGKSYTVQFSTDTLTWPTLFSSNAGFSSIAVTDHIAEISRLYRVISAP
jgi:hypothetical protein